MLEEMKLQARLYERIQPYERAGIPDEFYGILLDKEGQLAEYELMMERGELNPPSEEEQQAGYDRYKQFRDWREEAEKAIRANGEEEQ